MKCQKCGETINKKEPQCPNCGREIDCHWSIAAYKIIYAVAFVLSIVVFLNNLWIGRLNTGAAPDLGDNVSAMKEWNALEETALFIQVCGFIVALIFNTIVLYSLNNRKWGFVKYVFSAIPTIMYAVNMVYVVLCSVYSTYPFIGQLSSLTILIHSIVMMIIGMIGGKRVAVRQNAYKIKRGSKKDDKALLKCKNCGADLPKGKLECLECGEAINLESIYIPKGLYAWCSVLCFKLWEPKWRSKYSDMLYTPGDYDVPTEVTDTLICILARILMIVSIVFSVWCLFLCKSWLDFSKWGTVCPVYGWCIVATAAVFIVSLFFDRELIRAMNFKHWRKGVDVCLSIALIIRLVLAAVLVFFMLFVDARVLLMIPVLTVICVSQLVLVFLAGAVKKHMEIYNEYAKSINKKMEYKNLK